MTSYSTLRPCPSFWGMLFIVFVRVLEVCLIVILSPTITSPHSSKQPEKLVSSTTHTHTHIHTHTPLACQRAEITNLTHYFSKVLICPVLSKGLQKGSVHKPKPHSEWPLDGESLIWVS